MLKLTSIFENVSTNFLIKDIADLLNKRYKPTVGTIPNGLDIKQESAFENQLTGEIETLANVVDNLTIKYPDVRKEYLAQVVKDWYNTGFKDGNYILTQGVTPYKEF